MLFRSLQKDQGQALTEMLLVIPLLVLMLFGTVQLTILLQARVAFDKACGDVAREYAAGTINDASTFSNEFWTRLGADQRYFDQGSLSVNTQAPKPSLIDQITHKIDAAGPIAAKLRSYIINYGGKTWSIQINFIPIFSPAFAFPNGITFESQVTLLRYPA